MAVTSAQVQAAVAAVASAVAGVPDFSDATTAQLAPVTSALTAALALVSAAQAQTEAAISGVAGGNVAGMVAGAPGLAATLLNQAAMVQLLPMLDDLWSVLTRMQKNLVAETTDGYRVIQAGGDLYTLAVQAYGNEDLWTAIAEANNLTDPMLTGVNSLVIPSSPIDTGGILEP